jgi:hypothetical protein
MSILKKPTFKAQHRCETNPAHLLISPNLAFRQDPNVASKPILRLHADRHARANTRELEHASAAWEKETTHWACTHKCRYGKGIVNIDPPFQRTLGRQPRQNGQPARDKQDPRHHVEKRAQVGFGPRPSHKERGLLPVGRGERGHGIAGWVMSMRSRGVAVECQDGVNYGKYRWDVVGVF